MWCIFLRFRFIGSLSSLWTGPFEAIRKGDFRTRYLGKKNKRSTDVVGIERSVNRKTAQRQATNSCRHSVRTDFSGDPRTFVPDEYRQIRLRRYYAGPIDTRTNLYASALECVITCISAVRPPERPGSSGLIPVRGAGEKIALSNLIFYAPTSINLFTLFARKAHVLNSINVLVLECARAKKKKKIHTERAFSVQL